jgi:hypothetical protein
MHERWRRWIYRSRPLASRLLHEWSIGVYPAGSPLHLDAGDVDRNPVLTSRDDPGGVAAFVADPFLVRDGLRYWMFFEAMNARSGRGEIVLGASADGTRWSYEGAVLVEPFHLSFPCIARSGKGEIWMTPETKAAGAIRLYVADDFPRRWRLAAELIAGRFVDPCLFHHDDRWWLFATTRRGLHLFGAAHIGGPWAEHPQSPVVRDPGRSRSGGRPLATGGRLLRFAQDPAGGCVRAFDVIELSRSVYLEREAPESPVAVRRERWNAGGVHHLSACERPGGDWLVAIDGRLRRSGSTR